MDWLQYTLHSSRTTTKHNLLTLISHAKVSTALTAPKAGTVLGLNVTYLGNRFRKYMDICGIEVLLKAVVRRQAFEPFRLPQSCQECADQF